MILRLKHENNLPAEIPRAWRRWVQWDGEELLLCGDDTGSEEIHLSRSDHEIILGDDPIELLQERRSFAPLEIDPEALSYLLHDGQVPYPRTIFRDLFTLSTGDRVRIERNRERFSVRFSVEFPYFARLSRQDQKADPDHLLRLLTRSTVRRLEPYDRGILLLSAGKDSTALALALAESGRKDIRCVTYTSEGDDEYLYAEKVCRRLGLSHQTISLDSQEGDLRDTLIGFFRCSPHPGGDLAQIPTLLCIEGTGMRGGAVVDGTGNDAPFGYVPRKKDRWVARLTLGRWNWADRLKPLLHPGSSFNYLLRDPVEISWAGLRFRYPETKHLIRDAVNTSREWRKVRASHPGLDPIDSRGFLRGRHFEIGSQKQKVNLAAHATRNHGVYPFQGKEVIDYYFHLPEGDRFDRKHLINKRLLREMLHDRLDYDDHKIGKRGFQFDGAAFLDRNRDFVLQEIFECDLFSRKDHVLVEKHMKSVNNGRCYWHPMVGLFQFAGWYNHCEYLRG